MADNVAELRRRLATGKDLGEIFGYFLDHFADDPSFWDRGVESRDTVYTQYIAEVAQDRLGVEMVLVKILHQKTHPDIHMVHGFYEVNRIKSQLFYFTDLEFGMFLLCEDSGRCHYARIQCLPAGNPALKNWASVRQ